MTSTMMPTPAASSSLSPDAAPFHPVSYQPSHLYIYNNGMPSLVMNSEEDLSQLLRGIQDEALDEGFPPDAQEAAELEAVQAFVDLMATFAVLEDREEQAQIHADWGLLKRWEARRAAGLQGRPRPARHTIDSVQHGTTLSSQKCTELAKSQRTMMALQNKMGIKEVTDRRAEPRAMKRGGSNGVRPNIQQPRKQY